LWNALHKRREAAFIGNAGAKTLSIDFIGAANGPLTCIELVRARLALVEGETWIVAYTLGSLAHFSAVECGSGNGRFSPHVPASLTDSQQSSIGRIRKICARHEEPQIC